MSKYTLGSGSQIDKDYESALLLKKGIIVGHSNATNALEAIKKKKKVCNTYEKEMLYGCSKCLKIKN